MKLRLACFVALVICASSLSGKVIEGLYHTNDSGGWSIFLRPDGRAGILNSLKKTYFTNEKNRWRNLSNGDAVMEIWDKGTNIMKCWIRTTSRGTYVYEIRAWPFRPEDAEANIRKTPTKFRRVSSLKER